MEPVVVQADRHGHVGTGHLFADQCQGVGVGLIAPQVGHRHAEELGQGIDQAALFEHAHRDQQLTQTPTGLSLKLEGLLDLGVGDQAAEDQDVTELLTRMTRCNWWISRHGRR